MALTAMQEHRRDAVKKALLPERRRRLEATMRTCHIQFGYDGRLPPTAAGVTDPSQLWRAQVGAFIAECRREAESVEGT